MESPATPEGESPAQRQARLRRERRQAKIAAGGTDRLNKIMGVSGRSIPESDLSSGKSHQVLNVFDIQMETQR